MVLTAAVNVATRDFQKMKRALVGVQEDLHSRHDNGRFAVAVYILPRRYVRFDAQSKDPRHATARGNAEGFLASL